MNTQLKQYKQLLTKIFRMKLFNTQVEAKFKFKNSGNWLIITVFDTDFKNESFYFIGEDIYKSGKLKKLIKVIELDDFNVVKDFDNEH